MAIKLCVSWKSAIGCAACKTTLQNKIADTVCVEKGL